MSNRFLRTYAYILLWLLGLLGMAALLEHLSWLIAGEAENRAARAVFAASIFCTILAFGFVSERAEWVKQVKVCPRWMHRTIFGLGIYAIGLTCIELAFGERPGAWFTTFPLAGDAIGFGLLYAGLYRGYLTNVGTRELRNQVAWSWAVVGCISALAILHATRK